jgi:hypothetical protein
LTYLSNHFWAHCRVDFTNDLISLLKETLAADTVLVITYPVDYAENLHLTSALGRASRDRSWRFILECHWRRLLVAMT